MPNKISLRHASIQDLDLLIGWDAQEHVREGVPDEYWDWENELPRNPEWREQLIAELDGKPIGFIQIIDPKEEETHYWGKIGEGYRALDIWIGERSYLGKGYGTQMMRLAIERCFANNTVHTIILDPLEANKAAHRFYERLGFQFIETRLLGNDMCKVYEINRDQLKLNLD